LLRVDEVTPWATMLRTGAALGVRPEAFWRLSLAEWRMLTEAAPGVAPMGRGDFERLMAVWPDGGGT
jgi:uncharacterized phage protein (TIGR02216 family)